AGCRRPAVAAALPGGNAWWRVAGRYRDLAGGGVTIRTPVDLLRRRLVEHDGTLFRSRVRAVRDGTSPGQRRACERDGGAAERDGADAAQSGQVASVARADRAERSGRCRSFVGAG